MKMSQNILKMSMLNMSLVDFFENDSIANEKSSLIFSIKNLTYECRYYIRFSVRKIMSSKFKSFSCSSSDACSSVARINLFNFSDSREVKNERRRRFESNFDDQVVIKMIEASESIMTRLMRIF